MKTWFFVCAIAATTMAVAGSPAYAQNYPWCAHYDTGDSAYNCGFTTLQQCHEDVSGIGGFCEPNNLYQPPPGPHPTRGRS
jgi:hypothetical protein